MREAKIKAMEDNKKKALETGNLLTQTIDADGNLISVKDLDTETGTGTGSGFGRAGAEISVADLRKELFEGENIVTSKDNDHGLSRVAEVRDLPT